MPRILHLHVKAIYFQQMQAGEKPFEYRSLTPYWTKRLTRDYDQVWVYSGYPPKGLDQFIRKCLWQGLPKVIDITHEHFGNSTQTVFAIDVSETIAPTTVA